MCFHADLGGRDQAVSNRSEPRFAIAMPAPIDMNGFETEIDGAEVGAGGDTSLPQDGGTKQAAEPRRVLKHGKLVPCIESDDGAKHRRQVFDLAQHAAPFVEPAILIPIEIVNQRIHFNRTAAGAGGPCCIVDRGIRPSQHRIDIHEIDAREILNVVDIDTRENDAINVVLPSPSTSIEAMGRTTPAVSASPGPTDVISDVCRKD